MTSFAIGAIGTKTSNIAYKYRWELTLFFGIPLAADTISWIVWQFVSITPVNMTGRLFFDRYQLLGLPYSFVILDAVILGILWIRVRILDRNYLSLIWLYAFSRSAVIVLFPIGTQLIAYLIVDDYPIHRANMWFHSPYFWTIQWIIQVGILGYFAILASKISLRHAFILFGISAALNSGIDVFRDASYFIYDVGISYDRSYDNLISPERDPAFISGIIFRALMSLLAVVVLAHFNSTMSRYYYTRIASILGVALLMNIPYGRLYWTGAWYYSGSGGFLDAVRIPGSFENFIVGYALVLAIMFAFWKLFSRDNSRDGNDSAADTNQSQTPEDLPAETSPLDAGRSP